MKKYSYLLLIFLLVSNSFIKSQQLPRDIILSEFISKARTNDLLYINDTVVYLMSKSPLEAFPGYKDLYASFDLPQTIPWIPYGVRVNRRGTTYHVLWCLRDSMLYLSDIDITHASFCEYKSFFPNNEQYKLMEELTKAEFNKSYPLPSGSPPLTYHNTIGMMPATWSNDTILIKMSRGQYLGGQGKWRSFYCADLNDTIWYKRPAPSLEFDKWITIPSEELIFKNGKLISRERTDIY